MPDEREWTVMSDERFLSGGVTLKGPVEVTSGTVLVEASRLAEVEREKMAADMQIEDLQLRLQRNVCAVLDRAERAESRLEAVEAERDEAQAVVRDKTSVWATELFRAESRLSKAERDRDEALREVDKSNIKEIADRWRAAEYDVKQYKQQGYDSEQRANVLSDRLSKAVALLKRAKAITGTGFGAEIDRVLSELGDEMVRAKPFKPREPSVVRDGGYQGSSDPGRPTQLMQPQTRPVSQEKD